MKKAALTYRLINLVLATLLLPISVLSQIDLPTQIRTNTTLTEGAYLVSGIHYISKDALLTIKGNASLIFDANATIRVDGGLKIEGEPNKLVNITSRDRNQPGNGFVINGISNEHNVEISYSRFNYIKKPITFEFRWSRKGVSIVKNVFKNSLYEGAAIEIKEHDNLLTPSKIIFNLKDNTFCNSTSSILISNITADLLTIHFENNVITRNNYTGRSRNGIFTSPLYFTYNLYQNNEIPVLKNNSIFDNYYSYYYDESFDIGRTNISAVGNADKLNLSNNYFGNPENREIEESFDYISANYQAPYLFLENSLDIPPANLNGHFYKVQVNDLELDEKLDINGYKDEIDHIDLLFNRPVINGSNFSLAYYYESADTIAETRLDYRLKWSEGKQGLRLVITESLKKYGKLGYLEIDGLYDSEGMDVPVLLVGEKAVLDPELRTYIPLRVPAESTKKEASNTSPLDSLLVINPTQEAKDAFTFLNDSSIQKTSKFWDYGVFMGNALYFGDLNSTTVSIDPRNMKPGGGLRLGYQATERWRYSFTNNYSLISGSDNPTNSKNKNQRGTGFKRDLSFRTFIAEAAILAEYNFTTFKKKKSIVPSIYTGANVFYFKPQGQVEGDNQWYDLREIGTAGQTINGDNKYAKVMVGIPMGVSLKRHITQKTIVSLSYTYVKLFTDYLDDVSTDPYPEDEALKAANPDLGPVAVTLSNPGNQTGLRSYSSLNDAYGYWGITFSFKIY